jgi:hypothetical protein
MAEDSVNLNEGNNVYYVVVTAEDGTTELYRFTVTVPEKNNVFLYFLFTILGIAIVIGGLLVYKKIKKVN